MTRILRMLIGGSALTLFFFTSGCVIAPREGYYDRTHHRYYHDHGWHRCTEHDAHCR